MNDETVKQGNINDLISIMNKANDTFSYEVFVPSLDRVVNFREINTSQQKKLVKSIIDSPVFNTEFIFALRDIIEENCADSSVDVGELTIYDKLIIALYMRIYSIGDELTISLKCPNCEKSHPVNIHLNDLLEEVKGNIDIESFKEIEDENGVFKVFCGLPTINTEYNLENEFRKNTKIEIDNEDELRETIGNVFTSELVKYIQKIEIKNDEKLIELELDGMKFEDRSKLVGQLNVKLLKKIVEFIGNVKKEFDKILLVQMNCDCDKKTKMEQRFSIDSNFFIIS